MSIYNLSGENLNDIGYDVTGALLSQAYDIEANELFDGSQYNLNIIPDESSGTASGYTFAMQNSGNTYIMREVVDFSTDSYALQSFCYDYDNNLYYKFDASTTVRVYSPAMQKINTITMPQSAGHNNDACYHNGSIYLPNDNTPSSSIYVWNIANNTVQTISISGILQPSNGSNRGVEAICEKARGSGEFYLVCRDSWSDSLYHDTNDKLSVYLFDLSTGNAVLQAEFPWDCVFLQGATFLDGILYCACNTQTTGSAGNYVGITLKAIRTDTWVQLDSLISSGNYEPEGLDVIPQGNKQEIMMGMGKYMTISKIVRFTSPYKLAAGEEP